MPAIQPLQTVERNAIVRALRLCSGNKKAAASKLGIDRSTMHRKLKQHDILDDEYV